MTRRPLRALSAVLFAAVVSIVSASAAGAHVIVDDVVANADGTSTFSFSFNHGCGATGTVEVHTKLPDGVTTRSTSEPDGWTSTVEADGSVRWQGPEIPDDDVGRFGITTDRFGNAGDTVTFPTVQRCVDGELAWLDDDPAGERPAPVTVLDADTAADPLPAVPEGDTSAAVIGPADTSSGGDGASTGQVALVVTVGSVIAIAGLPLVLARRDRRAEGRA